MKTYRSKFLKVVMVVFLASLMAFTSTNVAENAPPSLADHLKLVRSKDPVDGGWLPNLKGLPDRNQTDLLIRRVVRVMSEEKESRCTAIDFNLRMFVFQHFAVYQHIANAQGIYFDDQIATTWAHVLAMTLKESSGDPTSVTDMTGRAVTTYKAQSTLKRWKNILKLAAESRIKLNYQTNYGLPQTSADRLFVAFRLAANKGYDTEFLEGKEGASTPSKVSLNTAIAIRRLIWFYQDFAQGRITQSDSRIHQRDINKPEYYNRYKAGLKMALLYCGTRFMLHETNGNNDEKLENAMASIAYCKLGNAQSGYGKNEFDEKCFAEWVTLCPALNIDIAIITPLSYFATRNEKPVCVDTFKRLLTKKHEPGI